MIRAPAQASNAAVAPARPTQAAKTVVSWDSAVLAVNAVASTDVYYIICTQVSNTSQYGFHLNQTVVTITISDLAAHTLYQ